MSTIVYQNHASLIFDSQITETTTTTTLKLKVASPTTTFDDLFSHHSAAPKQYSSSFEKQSSFYTPRLSAKSLELCTECLGSETGSGTIEYSSSMNFELKESNERTFVHDHEVVEKKNNSCRKIMKKNFPPPLTSSLQVRSRREDGRLVIEAVEAPVRMSCLQAERRDGRLKLCFSITGENEDDIEAEDDEEMNMEKFGRMMNRCINGNEELCSSNWKSALWVATS